MVAVRNQEQRNLAIDVSKGIGILLVVLGHNWLILQDKGCAYRVIYSFHMPLFFFLSGFLGISSPLLVFLKRRARGLLLPYLVSSILAAAFYVLIKGQSVQEIAVFFLYGTSLPWPLLPMWFLPHLLFLNIIGWDILRACGSNKWKVLGASLMLFVVGWVFGCRPVQYKIAGVSMTSMPWALDLTLLILPYFLVGSIIRGFSIPLSYLKMFIFSLAGFIGLHMWSTANLDYLLRVYDSIIISTAKAMLGICCTYSLANLILKTEKIAAPLAAIGVGSLNIMILHPLFQDVSLRFRLGSASCWGCHSHDFENMFYFGFKSNECFDFEISAGGT